LPHRRNGMVCSILSLMASGRFCVMSVSMNPGAIALARILRAPNSLLRDFISPIIPALEAA
jgi:hypothetical protein